MVARGIFQVCHSLSFRSFHCFHCSQYPISLIPFASAAALVLGFSHVSGWITSQRAEREKEYRMKWECRKLHLSITSQMKQMVLTRVRALAPEKRISNYYYYHYLRLQFTFELLLLSSPPSNSNEIATGGMRYRCLNAKHRESFRNFIMQIRSLVTICFPNWNHMTRSSPSGPVHRLHQNEKRKMIKWARPHANQESVCHNQWLVRFFSQF